MRHAWWGFSGPAMTAYVLAAVWFVLALSPAGSLRPYWFQPRHLAGTAVVLAVVWGCIELPRA